MASWVVPTIVTTFLWRWMLNADYGIVNHMLIAVGLVPRPIDFLGSPNYAFATVVWINAWRWFPFLTLLILAALTRIAPEYYEAASIEGATTWQLFTKVTLPFLQPVLYVVGLLGTLWSVNVFDIIWLTTKGGPLDATTTLPVSIYIRAFQQFKLGKAARSRSAWRPSSWSSRWSISASPPRGRRNRRSSDGRARPPRPDPSHAAGAACPGRHRRTLRMDAVVFVPAQCGADPARIVSRLGHFHPRQLPEAAGRGELRPARPQQLPGGAVRHGGGDPACAACRLQRVPHPVSRPRLHLQRPARGLHLSRRAASGTAVPHLRRGRPAQLIGQPGDHERHLCRAVQRLADAQFLASIAGRRSRRQPRSTAPPTCRSWHA